MMQSQVENKGERVSTVQRPRIENKLGDILRIGSGVDDAIIKGVVVQSSIPICLIDAFRQSWEHRWLSLLPKKEDITDSRTVHTEITELVSADLFRGSRYTKDTWSRPKD